MSKKGITGDRHPPGPDPTALLSRQILWWHPRQRLCRWRHLRMIGSLKVHGQARPLLSPTASVADDPALMYNDPALMYNKGVEPTLFSNAVLNVYEVCICPTPPGRRLLCNG